MDQSVSAPAALKTGSDAVKTAPESVAATTVTASKTHARLKQLGELRDGVLVLVSIVYLLGYLSWACYAWKNDLGLIPALDAQYFVGGVLPALVLTAGLGLVVVMRHFYRWSTTTPSTWRQTVGKWIGWLGVGLVPVGLLVALVGGDDSYVMSQLGFLAMMSGALIQGSSGNTFLRVYGLLMLWISSIMVVLVLLALYALEWFPELPQELGGPFPKCVVVDIVTEDLSPQSRELFGIAATSEDRVHRSQPVDLLFDGSEGLLLRTKPPGNQLRQLIRVDKGSVLAVTPCVALQAPGESR